jgi:hypothetical protein
MSELEQTTSHELVIRHTGEIVNLEDPAECAVALVSIRDLEGELRWVKQRLSDAIGAAAARLGTKTLQLSPEFKAVISGGVDVQWDAGALMAGLREAGMPAERIGQIVEKVVTFKVNAVEAKRAAGANPEYAFVVDSCKTEVEAPIRVSVRRA